MARTPKGSRPNPEYVNAVEAANRLRVSVSAIRKYGREGILRSVAHPSHKIRLLYNTADLAQLAEILSKGISLSSLMTLTLKAYTMAQRNESRLQQLELLAGLKLPTLGTDAEHVTAVYLEAANMIDGTQVQTTTKALMHWAKVFLSIDEGYLMLVDKYVADPEPWKIFLDLALFFTRVTPRAKLVKDELMNSSFGFFRLACKHLRHTCYLYIQRMHGRKIARKLLPGDRQGSTEDRILLMLSLQATPD